MHYAIYHGVKRCNEVTKCLIDLFGEESQYVSCWKYGPYLYTNNTMIINREDFDKMCEFVFKVLFELDKRWKLGLDSEKYEKNAYKYTEDGRYDYQRHFMAYIGERMVSLYITRNLKVLPVERLKNNGFYKPYGT